MMNIYRLVAEQVEQGHSLALATIVQVTGSTPRNVGAKMLIYADGRIEGTIGGGKMEALVIEKAVTAIEQGRSQTTHFDLVEPESGGVSICGGTADIFIDVISPRPILLVVGGGHVAMPTAEIGALCGFHVVVIDDRAEMVTEKRFPRAEQRISKDIVPALDAFSITQETHIVIVTRGHAFDEHALRTVIDSPAAYIGMIGSRKKVKTILEHLRADGIDESLIERVHSPIGLNIGSQTPAEIAVSILAEIIMLRNSEDGNSMKME